MSQASAEPRWTEAEFFGWLDGQEGRFEFVDGRPVAMTGGTQRHDRIVTNLIVALGGRLPPDGPCRPGSPDAGVRVPAGNVRYPDVLVDCGPFRDDERAASEPRLVVEVLSPSTRAFDQARKLDEYKSVPSLAHVLLLDPDGPRATLHTRGADGAWAAAALDGAGAVVPLDALGLALPLAEAYRGLPPRRPPRLLALVPEDDGEGG